MYFLKENSVQISNRILKVFDINPDNEYEKISWEQFI